jgi:hypothetical protein
MKSHRELNLSFIDNLQDELADMADLTQAINETLGQSFAVPEDVDEARGAGRGRAGARGPRGWGARRVHTGCGEGSARQVVWRYDPLAMAGWRLLPGHAVLASRPPRCS